MFIVNPYAFGGAPSQSIELDNTADYLSISDASWGSYDREKFAIAFSIYPTVASGEQLVVTKDIVSAGVLPIFNSEFEVKFDGTNGLMEFRFEDASGNVSRFRTNSSIGTSQWHSFLIWFDSANVTSSERIRVWRNGSELTASVYTAPTSGVTTNSNAVRIGVPDADGITTGAIRGNVWSFGFFSGSLPAASDVFDGASSTFRSFTALAGLKSYLAIEGGDVTYDSALATNWTNNGTTAASSRP